MKLSTTLSLVAGCLLALGTSSAFGNLINNAIKFTPDGGRIEIWGRVVQGPEPVIEIVIADSGVGIDPRDHDMIFDKFYRVESSDLHSTGTTKYKGAGPGLGLSIVKGVIEGHGGRIWVESEAYDETSCPGSRFHILLPIRKGFSDPDGVSAQLRKTRPVTGITKRLLGITRAVRVTRSSLMTMVSKAARVPDPSSRLTTCTNPARPPTCCQSMIRPENMS